MSTATAELRRDEPVEGVREIEHTADVALESEADSLAGCLAHLAAGMFGLMYVPPEAPSNMRWIEVELSSPSPRDLLVGWLEELLYRSDVDGTCFVRFEVETDGRWLKARVAGVALSDGVEPAGAGIKAVTRHGVELREERGRWWARVFLDV